MKIKNPDLQAFTLMEVLLASVIFIISVGGLFLTLTAVRAPVQTKENQLAANVFSKQVLEYLHSQVDQSTFYSACPAICHNFDLTLATHYVNNDTVTAAGLTWPASLVAGNSNASCTVNPCLVYTVSCADGSGCANAALGHKVDLNIITP